MMINLDELKAKVNEKKEAVVDWVANHELETGMILMGASVIASKAVWALGYKKGVNDCSRIVEAYNLGYQQNQQQK